MTSVAFHVDQLFFRVPGGIGTYIRRLLPALMEQQPQLDLTVFHSRFASRPPADLNGFRRTSLRLGIRALYPLWNYLGAGPLPGALARTDVIHAPSTAAIPQGRRKLIVTVHDLAFRFYPKAYRPAWRSLHSAGFRRAVKDADAIIAVSDNTAADVARVGGVDAGRVHVVPLAASLPIGTEDPGPVLARLGVDRPYVLFVGNLEPRKNIGRLITAFRRVAGKLRHSLVLAGPVSQRLRETLVSVDRERMVVTGHVSERDLDALHRGADAFVYPSLYEGFGLPVLDAMARGVPVITSNTSSLPEVAGDAATLVRPTSSSEIADALERVLTDEAERSRLAEAGRARAAAFSWERTASETLAIYEKVAAS